MKILKLYIFLIIFSASYQLTVAQNITTDSILANNNYEKAQEYFQKNSFDTAIMYFEKAGELYNKCELFRQNLLCEIKVSESFQKKWNLNDAISNLTSVINLFLKNNIEIDTIVAEAYNNLGLSYAYKSDFDSAYYFWNKSLQIYLSLFGEIDTKVAALKSRLGRIYFDKGIFDMAMKYELEALNLNIMLLGEKHPNVGDSYNNIGNLYWRLGDYDISLENHFKALEIRKNVFGPNHANTGKCYNNIGLVYGSKGEFDLAIEYYLKALDIKKLTLGDKHISIGGTCLNIGNAYRNKGDFSSALNYLNNALKIVTDLNSTDNDLAALVFNNLGLVYREMNEPDTASYYFIKALEIKKKIYGENHLETSSGYNNLGIVCTEKGNLDSALYYFLKAVKISNIVYNNDHPYKAQINNNIGKVYYDLNEFDKALKFYQIGIDNCLENFNDTVNINSVPEISDNQEWQYLMQALYRKAEIYIMKGKSSELNKIEYYNLALKHYQSCDTLINLVRLSIRTKSDKMALAQKADKVYSGAVYLCNLLSKSSKSDQKKHFDNLMFYFSEKNKASILLEALAGSEAQKFSGISDSLLKIETKMKSDIAFFKNILFEKSDSLNESIYRDKLFESNRKYDSLITVFERDYPRYYELKYNYKPVSIGEMQKIIDKNTALISVSICDSLIFLSVASNKKFEVFKIQKPNDFEESVAFLRENISNTVKIEHDYFNNTNITVDNYIAESSKLYNVLFPIELRKFISKKIKNLVIIPEGCLSQLPFETLLSDEYNSEWTGWNNTKYFSNMPFLVKDYNISYSYSANLLYQTSPKTKDQPEFHDMNDWLALAPVFDNDSISGTNLRTRQIIEKNSIDDPENLNTRAWLRDGSYISPLPGSEEETKNIFNIFESNNKKAVLKTHKFANEEYVKSGVLKDFRFLHIATHGMVNEDKPELSCILLAQDTTSTEDNILFSGEIYNLELNADLTVLSACETGLGKIAEGEGVIGLTRALLYAGSKNIIVSLWQVSDESTNQLMVDFYKNIFNNDYVGFSENLAQSKRKLIEEGKYAHPFFWSPFVLIGK